jgi:hypothetical protein
MEEIVLRALRPVEADLRVTGHLRLRILDEPAGVDDPPYASCQLVGSYGFRTGVLVDRGASEPENVTWVADQVQEFVLEELSRNGRSASWPTCPRHPNTHPLAAVLIEGTASWRCPKSLVVTAEIGSLAAGAAGDG